MMQAYKRHLVRVAKPHIKTQAKKGTGMEFLKELLGEEIYNQLVSKINEHNGNEANKDNQIKIGNLGKGDYVGRSKYEALDALLKGKEAELTTANGLIEQLKKGTKGNEELQGKITEYESAVADLQTQLQETKIKAAIKVALLSEKAVDVDYLTFKLNEKLKEKGEALELDENENIKGWVDKLSGLKTQFPSMFEAQGKDGYQVLGNNKLPGGDNRPTTPTKEEFLNMSYEQRVALKESNEQAYKQLTNKN